MKLYYYLGNNFGDKLNPMIWDALLPDVMDEDDSTLFVGIGTLINSKVPTEPRKVVFGSGAGYNTPALIDDKWKFYCVRGPLSAEILGLDSSLAITDPALLLAELVTKPVVPTGEVCFMPHHTSTNFADWGAICAKAGITYLDPAADMHTLIDQIRCAKLIITEAMHGAIVADAFRVPWVPVQCYEHVLQFKWQDWCQSMSLPYKPNMIASIWDIDKTLSPRDRLAAQVKRGLKTANIWSDNWTPPPPAPNLRKVEDEVVAAFRRLSSQEHAYLSDDRLQQIAMARLLEQIERVKTDHAKGAC